LPITRHLLLSGRVQGVFFRESMCAKAAELDVRGWVRNRADGRVEAMLQGENDRVEALLDWARCGPAAARVDKTEIAEGWGEYASFTRLPTD
jgi:acylphosphatase